MIKQFFVCTIIFFSFFLSKAQTFKWAQKIGGTSSDFARSIATDNNGNTFIIGGFNGTLIFPGTGSLASRSINSAGSWDIYVSKMDCNKNLVWKNSIGSSSSECGSFFFPRIKYDNKGNLYVTGAFGGSATFTTTSGTSQTLVSNGSDDIFLAKYDTLGVLQWAVKSGGSYTDEGCCINIDRLGNIVLGGLYSDISTFGTTAGSTISKTAAGGHDIFIAKYLPSGILQWVNTAGGSGLDIAIDIAFDLQNNILVTGNFGYSGASATFGSLTINNNSNWGGFIAKANPLGAWIWVNGMGTSADEGMSSCVVDEFGNVYTMGHFGSGNSSFSSNSPGVSLTLTNNGNYDACMSSHDSSGVLRWVRVIGGSGNEFGWHICFNKDENLVVSGNFSNTVNFGNSVILTSNGLGDGFICTVDPSNGSTINALKMGGIGNDDCFTTIPDNIGNLFTCGRFANTATFGTNSLISSGAEDSYFAKISPPNPFKLKPPISINLCSGDSSILYPIDTFSGVTFQWFRNNLAIAGANKFSYKAKLAGTYFLKVTNNCNEMDSSETITLLFTTANVNAGNDVTICKGDSVQLNAIGATNYFWFPSIGLSNVNIANPYAKPADTTTYIIRGVTGVCLVYDTVKVIVKPILAQAGIDSTICLGDSIRLNANAIGTAYWQNSLFLTDSNVLNTFVKPTNSINYILKVTNLGCLKYDTVRITVNNPQANAGIDKTICLGDSVRMAGSGTGIFKWSPNYFLFDSSQLNSFVKPQITTNYLLTASIGRCIKKDTVQVIVNQVSVQLGRDTSLCFGDSIRLTASTIGSIAWQKNNAILDSTLLNPIVKPQITSQYILEARSGVCVKRDTINVLIYHPISNASINQNICLGDSIQLNGTGYNSLKWYPSIGLTDSSVANTFAKPIITTDYILLAKDGYCIARDTVRINVTSVSANAGIDKGICPGDSVQLNANAIGLYYWENNLGLSNYTVLNPYAKPTITTKYILTATNNTCIKHDTVQVSVSLPLALNAGKDTSLCVGDSIQLIATGGFNYKWTPNSLVSDSTIFNPFVKPTTTTNFIVKSGFSGCLYADTINVLVRNLPMIDAGIGGQICVNDSFLLQGSGVGITRWYPNFLVKDSTSLITYSKPLTTTKFYLNVNNGYCKNRDSVNIIVNNPISINAGLDKTICEFDTTFLTVNGATEVSWNSAKYLSDSTSLNPKAFPKTTTKFFVKSINVQCPAFDTVQVNVNLKPIVNAGNDTILCTGFPFQLNGKVVNGDIFSWQPANEINNPTVLNPILSLPKSKYYYLNAVNSNGNCSANDSIKITMDSVIAIISSNVSKGGIPLKVQFNSNSINANSYLWDFDKLGSSIVENPIYIFENEGTYAVILHAKNNNGCVDTAMLTIIASGELIIHIPNVFTPNNDLINDNFENKLSSYGNLKYLKGTIWNRWGQQIYEYYMPNGNWWDGTYLGNDCSEGVYFYMIEAESKLGKKYKIHGTVTLMR